MPTQLTVRLPDDLRKALDAASRKSQSHNSEIVRMALRQFLQSGDPDAKKHAELVRGLLGILESGIPDLADKHREYILDSLPDGQ